MEQLVFLLVIGAIGLIQLAMKKSDEARRRAQTGGNPPPSRPTGMRPIDPFPRGDDAARKLREALGLPAETHVPPPVRRTPPPVPASAPAPSSESPRRLPSLIEAAEKIATAETASQRQAKAVRKKGTAPKASAAGHAPAPARSRLEELLHSSDGLRSAMLAREILGPPKGLEF